MAYRGSSQPGVRCCRAFAASIEPIRLTVTGQAVVKLECRSQSLFQGASACLLSRYAFIAPVLESGLTQMV